MSPKWHAWAPRLSLAWHECHPWTYQLHVPMHSFLGFVLVHVRLLTLATKGFTPMCRTRISSIHSKASQSVAGPACSASVYLSPHFASSILQRSIGSNLTSSCSLPGMKNKWSLNKWIWIILYRMRFPNNQRHKLSLFNVIKVYRKEMHRAFGKHNSFSHWL